ncbi:MAG: molybdopterin synthase sulfur carrier subunit [Gammaproteobacteria bacterium]|jgi:molybdopterin synthase sulfur carrier subunit
MIEQSATPGNAGYNARMTVTIKYFASLAEELCRREDRVSLDSASTVADAWHAANGDRVLAANVLTAVNHTYVERTHLLEEGDEVAFFPPVTGG